MLYILLIIIAVGVLLISEAGKRKSCFLSILAAMAGLGYLAFWIVIIAVGLLSDKDIRENTFTVLGTIILIIGPVHLSIILLTAYIDL